MDYKEDGTDHINIYSKGKTEIGRWLSNFSESWINTENGWFRSVEGYWYWLTTLNEDLRNLSGFKAKELGRKSEKIVSYSDEDFKNKICKAIDLKLKLQPKKVSEINLPLRHYYDYGGKRVEQPKYHWIAEHIEMRVKQLKEHYQGRDENIL